jgi:undecaprenyl pyrophosphate phosphatase UppP
VAKFENKMETKIRRRILGITFLVAALVMLILGMTFLERRLAPLPLLIYWLVCFALAFGAMIVAWRDLWAIHHETTDKQSDLLKDIVHEIVDETKRQIGQKEKN